MPFKFNDDGTIEIKDNLPVYVKDDGTEVQLDGDRLFATVAKLNSESAARRKKEEELTEKLSVFDGIDPKKAREALKTVANLEDGALMEAGKVEELKREISKAANDQLAAYKEQAVERQKALQMERDEATDRYHHALKTNAFANSKFISEQVALPKSAMTAMFSGNFKVENNRLIGYDSSAKPIYSGSNPGELADFEEALSALVDSHPDRDSMLKSQIKSGAGAIGGSGGGGGKTVSASDNRAFIANLQEIAEGTVQVKS